MTDRTRINELTIALLTAPHTETDRLLAIAQAVGDLTPVDRAEVIVQALIEFVDFSAGMLEMAKQDTAIGEAIRRGVIDAQFRKMTDEL